MTDRSIMAIRGSVGPDAWPQVPDGETGQAAIVGHQLVYYPYDWCLFRCRAHTWFGATATRLSCLVDCRTRTSATADPFETVCHDANDALILGRRVDADTSLCLARRYAAYALRQKHKALVLPHLDLLQRECVYKPFWIVDCQMDDGRRQERLVDGLTGEHCALPAQETTAISAFA